MQKNLIIYFFQKKIQSKNSCVQNDLEKKVSKPFGLKNIFGPKHIFGPKKFDVNTIWVRGNLGSRNLNLVTDLFRL